MVSFVNTVHIQQATDSALSKHSKRKTGVETESFTRAVTLPRNESEAAWPDKEAQASKPNAPAQTALDATRSGRLEYPILKQPRWVSHCMHLHHVHIVHFLF